MRLGGCGKKTWFFKISTYVWNLLFQTLSVMYLYVLEELDFLGVQ